MPAFVQLPGPHGVTERSCDIASIMVAGPNPSTVPVPVFISWKRPRSAIRFVTDTLLSWKRASNCFESLDAPDAELSATPLARVTSAAARSSSRIVLVICLYLLSDGLRQHPRRC